MVVVSGVRPMIALRFLIVWVVFFGVVLVSFLLIFLIFRVLIWLILVYDSFGRFFGF